MKNMLYYVICVALIISIGAVCIVFASGEDDKNIEFLADYGWNVEPEHIEKEALRIPDIFDEVYNNYNELQKLSGLNLEKYKGRNAVRYTYKVKNFPIKTDDEVRANVLCVADNPIAGDIMTVALDGFMYSLNYLNTKR